ncbi:MAG TPA: phospholipase A [Noviherbaspirillum sp.]|uniref:phospholipase A n=1 Tax=Noviherbaspirillum sp. TaxID=1926288 RepID=UPI002B46AF16|nr:phospholipase A [Noviherbaspirillum sp.]HJV87770.1 phospholipase A [Noviherbaspirillum sp.]
MKKKSVSAAAMAMLIVCGDGIAQSLPATIQECTTIADDASRLACYDSIARRQAVPVTGAAEKNLAADDQQVGMKSETSPSRMAEHWELDAANKRGVFHFRPHQDNYLIATYTTHPNESPYRPFRQLDPNAELAHSELAFQLGFKLKLAENPGNLPLDIWFGYTQRSFWQAGNREASSPFRETNYEPEVMAVFPVNVDLLGFKLRFVNLSLVHQSNGGGSTLSRSWNRTYVQAGLERGDFQLLARAWKRINEDANNDDNPRIVDYMGHGDLVANYRRQGHEFSLLTRYNFNTKKGAAQVGWAYPVSTRLKGYIQYFSGYGYTLIDYNAYQRVVGVGILVTY